MADQKTTETLRATLFDVIDKVIDGSLDTDSAKVVGIMADKIIATAELELKHSETVSRLDAQGQGINTGTLLLVNKNEYPQ